MVEEKAFLVKPKYQCHLSQWEELVYGSKSWKERRLLCESMFIQIDKGTLILKNGGKRSFLYKTKELMSFIPMRRMSLWFPIMKRKEIIMWIRVSPNSKMILKTVGGKAFLMKPKHQFIYLSQLAKWDYGS